MLAKDILKSSTQQWAVVSRTAYVDKRARSTGNVRRGSCDKVSLVSTEYYSKTNRVSDDLSSFSKALSTEKSKGFLVSMPGPTCDIYRVVPSADFIGVWDEMDKVWENGEAEAKKAEEERDRKRKVEQLATQSLQDNVAELEQSAKKATAKLLGDKTTVEMYVHVTGEWNDDFSDYRARVGGRVTLSFSDYQRLLEKVFEAQDALA